MVKPCRARSGRGAEDGERIGDLEPVCPEAKDLRRPATRRPVRSPFAGRLDSSSSEQDASEVRRGDLVTECGRVHVPELGERERLGGEREADVRVRELAAQPLASGEDDRAVVERRLRQLFHRVPACVRGYARVDPERHEPEVGSRELPALRVSIGLAPRPELLEVCHLAHVHFRCEMAENRLLEGLMRGEHAARKRPCSTVWLAATLPEQHLETFVSHLEHHRERGVSGWRAWMLGRGKLRHEVIASQAKTNQRKTSMSDTQSTRVDDRADLLVVGSGVAGLFAALCAASEADVLLISKGPLLASTSSLAQGGIAAAVGEDDSPVLHAADTVRAGRGICRPSAVAALTGEAPARIRDLVELGVEFDDDLGLEGGHERRRVVHAGGAATGDRVARSLAERALSHPRIRIAEGERLLALDTIDGRCVGAITDSRRIAARTTLLATGGAAALWERTTNPRGATGEGMTAAYRAGAALADLEFVQFHPTTLVDSSVLLSEALRGEGAVLLDEWGRRFTDELGPRDVVARDIAARGTALLDLRAIDRDRFPTLMDTLEESGYDPATVPIPVAPAAHYTVGGIVTDLDGRSEVPGLYAAGECAATGVHGANRLASNSLLECLVFGRRAALASLNESNAQGFGSAGDLAPAPDEPVTDELRHALWTDCGLVREAAGLERLRAAPHLLTRLIAESALAREESRGSHFRADFSSQREEFERHVVLRPGSAPEFETWQ